MLAEIVGGDAHHFHVIERGAGGSTHVVLQQSDFAEIIAAREVCQNHFPAGMVLRKFYKADAHQIKAVGRVALATYHLPGREAQQFDFVAQAIDEFIG